LSNDIVVEAEKALGALPPNAPNMSEAVRMALRQGVPLTKRQVMSWGGDGGALSHVIAQMKRDGCKFAATPLGDSNRGYVYRLVEEGRAPAEPVRRKTPKTKLSTVVEQAPRASQKPSAPSPGLLPQTPILGQQVTVQGLSLVNLADGTQAVRMVLRDIDGSRGWAVDIQGQWGAKEPSGIS
jgi:hypothetical protein